MLSCLDEAKSELERVVAEINSDPEHINVQITGVSISEEKEIDGHIIWKYSFEGLPLPATRFEQWIRDDALRYSLLGCFEHSIEQVVNGEVTGPDHKH